MLSLLSLSLWFIFENVSLQENLSNCPFRNIDNFDRMTSWSKLR